MRKTRRNSGLFKYLADSKILETGSESEILECKKQYWLQYRREHKRKKRKQKREFIVSFHISEMQNVLANAKARGLTIPDYLREAVRADIRNSYVIPQAYAIKEVEQVLVSYKRLIEDIRDKQGKSWLRGNQDYEALITVIQKMESHVHTLFREAPPFIRLVEQQLQMNPYFITDLTNLIHSYGTKGYDKAQ